jgi:phage terminase small subunit
LEYVKDFNGTRAAQRAGYSGSDKVLAITACKLLGLDKVKGRIEALVQDRCMGAHEALTRLAEQARGMHSAYIGSDGSVDLESLIDAGLAHLIKGTKWDRDGNLIVEFYDAQAALVHIGKAHGIFREIREHRGNEKHPIIHKVKGFDHV